ncbi:zinc ribbon domain-containing protein [Mycobacterium sp. MMS18-G62]
MYSIPLVDYLMLDDAPYLVANECTHCQARYFDRRSGCAKCGGRDFRSVRIADTGILRTFVGSRRMRATGKSFL